MKEREAREEQQRIEAKRRGEFQPCLLVLHPSPRHSITILAMTLGGTVEPVPLPEDIAERAWREQQMIVRSKICRHQERSAKGGVDLDLLFIPIRRGK